MFKELKDKIKIVSKSKKIKVFYFGNTAGIKKSEFQLTSIIEYSALERGIRRLPKSLSV